MENHFWFRQQMPCLRGKTRWLGQCGMDKDPPTSQILSSGIHKRWIKHWERWIKLLGIKTTFYIYAYFTHTHTEVCKTQWLSHGQLFVTSWTIAHQAPLSMGFSQGEYWSGVSCPSPRIFLTQGSNLNLLWLLHWLADSLPLSHLEIPHIYIYTHTQTHIHI